MKHIFFFFFLLSVWLRPAQAQTTDSLSQKLTSIFANVDKSQVPTGYLYEAGVRFVEPRFFNGVLTDSNRIDMNLLRYLRAQLRSCRVASSDTLPTLPAFNARLKSAAAAAGSGVIPVAVQYLRYASIRPDALQNNLLRAQSEQLFDVAGRTQSPYQTNTLFAAAPNLSYSPTNAVSFLFRRNLYLTGTGEMPTTLFLDFGDGNGYHSATWGQAIGTNYPSAGVKRVKVRFGYASGASYESWFDFNVLAVAVANRYDISNGKNMHLQPVGAPYGANVSIRYGRGHGPHVVKPFIVVEQYNIARAAPSLVDCNNANNTVDLFLPKIGQSFTGSFDFDDKLEAAGYDLVYIDFDQNTDDITRNAKVVEYIIQAMNTEKNTSRTQFGLATDQNVVMGMSMGGLVGRYALAEMTKNNGLFGPPDTRLFILHDSPQRGAYNPVGLQSLARSTDVPLNIVSLNPFSSGFLAQPTIAAFDDRLQDAVNVLNEPATQQLALLNAFDGRGNIRTNTFIDGVYGDMVDFTRSVNAGKPQPAYEIVATSDGSQCGRGSGAPLGVALSTADTYTSGLSRLISFLNPVPYLGNFSLGVRGAAYGLPAYGQQATVSRMRVYIEYRLGIGYGPVSISIPIRFNLLNESAPSPPNTLPYETLPGGTTNLSTESGNCANQTSIVGAFLRTTLYNGPICFVPSYSALDVPTVAPATAFAKYIDNTTDNTSQPRVARYIAQESTTSGSTVYNLNHLTFTARNSEWIYDVMQGLPYASNYCSTECSPFPAAPTIVGNDYFCLNGNSTTTYTIPNQPAGTTINWTATTTAGTVTPASYTGSSYTLTANSTSAGTVTIQAVVTKNTCTVATVQRQVALGPQFRVTVVRTGCNNLVTVIAPGYNNLSLTINGDTKSVSNGTQVPATFEARQLQVGLTGTNACTGQNSSYANTYKEPANSNCPQRVSNNSAALASPAVKMFPNPAGGYVDVHLDRAAVEGATSSESPRGSSFVVRIYNTYGQLWAEQPSPGSVLRLSTAALPTGLYVVVMLRDGRIFEHQQLQVTH